MQMILWQKKIYITPKDFENKPLILPRRSNVQNEILSWLGEYFDEKNLNVHK